MSRIGGSKRKLFPIITLRPEKIYFLPFPDFLFFCSSERASGNWWSGLAEERERERKRERERERKQKLTRYGCSIWLLDVQFIIYKLYICIVYCIYMLCIVCIYIYIYMYVYVCVCCVCVASYRKIWCIERKVLLYWVFIIGSTTSVNWTWDEQRLNSNGYIRTIDGYLDRYIDIHR